MAFLTGNIELQIYTDSQQTEFPSELIPSISKTFEDTSVTGVQPLVFSLAASGTQAINLNGLAVSRVYLHSASTALNVNFNGLGTVSYEAGIPGFMPITVTSLSVTNSSSSTATTVTVILVTA